MLFFSSFLFVRFDWTFSPDVDCSSATKTNHANQYDGWLCFFRWNLSIASEQISVYLTLIVLWVLCFLFSNPTHFCLFYFFSVNSLLNNSQYWFECAYAAYANELIIFQLKDVNKFFRKQFLNGKIKMKANICNWKASMKTSSCIVIANQVKCNTLPYLFMFFFLYPSVRWRAILFIVGYLINSHVYIW